MINEVLFFMLKLILEEYEILINNDCLKIFIGKNIILNIFLKLMIL